MTEFRPVWSVAAASAVVAVSDGAGSASCSAEGARMAVEALAAHLAESLGADGDAALDNGLLRDAFVETRTHVLRAAYEAGRPARDYACTLLAVIVRKEQVAVHQIGDGVVVYRLGDANWSLAIHPQRGEYANETFFLTDDDAMLRTEGHVALGDVTELAVLTDGLQGQVVEAESVGVADRFLNPLLSTLRHQGAGDTEAISSALGRFLQSEAVMHCTDDDTTLVLATRRAAVEEVGDFE
jgi:hypothetical protein